MTSRKTRSKYKKARLANGRSVPVTTPSNYNGTGKYTIKDTEPVADGPPLLKMRQSKYEIKEGGPETNSTHVFMQRLPWLVELPIDDLQEGQVIDIPLDDFRSDPELTLCRSFTPKVMDRVRGNLRMFFEAKYPHIAKKIGTKHRKEEKVMRIFRRKDDATSLNSNRYERGENKLLAATTDVGANGMRPNLSHENRMRLHVMLKDNPEFTLSGIVNDMIDIWFRSND